MKSNDINFEDFMKISMERASRIFHQTEQCKLLIANSQKAQQDLKFNFNADDYAYIEDCFEIMMQLEWSSAEFLYQRAYKDCVELLKNLEVIK